MEVTKSVQDGIMGSTDKLSLNPIGIQTGYVGIHTGHVVLQTDRTCNINRLDMLQYRRTGPAGIKTDGAS